MESRQHGCSSRKQERKVCEDSVGRASDNEQNVAKFVARRVMFLDVLFDERTIVATRLKKEVLKHQVHDDCPRSLDI